MENYDDFIRSRYNTLNEEDDYDEDEPLTPSSLIVFRGARVLPPLLNEQERAEMRRLREAAVSLMKRRREEESHISSTDSSDDITDCDIITPSAPLTSTAHDDRSSNQPRASPEDDSPENTQITVLFENHETHGPRDTTRNTTTMMSSGYVTNDDTDVAGRSGRTEASGSDIISHAPVDGATLEEEIVAPLPNPAGDPSSDPDEGPYRTSLQNLLKKSQEYRRRQRLLRSQSRAAEEHNLSDKENQEILMCRTEGDASTDQRHALPAELPVTDSTQKSRPSSAARFTNIPTPKFCLSPVRCKRRSRIPGLVRRALGRPAPTDLIGSSDGGGNDTMMSSQTEQITQLELNLSSLKALISDLESTLTLSQTESPTDDGQKRPPTVTFSESVTAKDCGVGQENPASIRSLMGVLADTSNCSVDEAGSSVIGSSYDVDVPSGLWKQLTPETGGHEGVSRVKRRLLMNEDAAFSPGRETGSALCSTPRGLQASAQMQEDQVTALMEEECRQQQDLLQSLALRYQFLRSVSFPCPSAGSRLEDTPSSLTASSVCTHAELTDASRSCVPVSCRPLLAAVLRGFLTRRLLRTDRVSQLITTITDTRMFLQSLTEVSCSKHDVLLQERVSLQLRAARDELHQIFFSMSSSDQMKMIRCDRQLSRERQLRTHDHKVKGSLSAATRKALERKKLKLQRKTADRKRFSPSSEDTWKLVPKICRVSKKITPLRGER